MKKLKSMLKRLKKWSTRKTTLWYAIIGMTLYMLMGTIYTLISGNYLDSTITTSWFDALKWVVGLGGTITVAELVKQPSKPKEEPKNDDEEPQG